MTRTAAPVLAALLVLAGCNGDGGNGGDGGGYGAPGDPDAGLGGATSLATAETDLGTIVVDGEGRTVYQFDSDTQGSGESTCTGDCLMAWPPVPGGDPGDAEGVTGELGSITGPDGEPQLTLDGWPLYYYASDTGPGDTTGQGVNDVWWVLSPEGEPIRE
jgi:predicted lipoprotein with Yx(FWY)xxD motif